MYSLGNVGVPVFSTKKERENLTLFKEKGVEIVFGKSNLFYIFLYIHESVCQVYNISNPDVEIPSKLPKGLRHGSH